MLITAGWTDKSERGGEGEMERVRVSAREVKKGSTQAGISPVCTETSKKLTFEA